VSKNFFVCENRQKAMCNIPARKVSAKMILGNGLERDDATWQPSANGGRVPRRCRVGPKGTTAASQPTQQHNN